MMVTFRSLTKPLMRSISCFPSFGISDATLRAVVCETDFKKYDSLSDHAQSRSSSASL